MGRNSKLASVRKQKRAKGQAKQERGLSSAKCAGSGGGQEKLVLFLLETAF